MVTLRMPHRTAGADAQLPARIEDDANDALIVLELALERLRDRWWDDADRARAVADVAASVARIGFDALPHFLRDSTYAEARLLTIAMYGADVLEGLAVRLEAAPYSMTVAARRHAFGGIRIDADGYRMTIRGTTPVSRDAFELEPGRRVLIVGNSTSFGVGVSADHAHVASRLHAVCPAVTCFNASVKGSNLLQQATVADERLPVGADLVVIAGALDLVYALSWPRDAAHGALPFWNVGDPDLTAAPFAPIDPASYAADDAFTAMRRAITSLARTARSRGGRMLFVLQPHLDLSPKARTPREQALALASSTEIGAFKPVHAAAALATHAATFAPWLGQACIDAGADFLDANRSDRFLTDDDLFQDHIHLNDRGHQRMAELIAGWL